MIDRNIDEAWLRQRVLSTTDTGRGSKRSVEALRELLLQCASGFAEQRSDVVSAKVRWPRRGLFPDEAASFLRAVETGTAVVDEAGYVSLPSVRSKVPVGRYSLLSKSGNGVSVNLEYLIQIGATAELVLDHGWAPSHIDFERGEFDAIGTDQDGRALLVMEAKARVSGPDSLEKLLTSWLRMSRDQTIDLNNNAGRKYRDLQKRCKTGAVVVWLVAAGARWSLVAELTDGSVRFTPASDPTPELCRNPIQEATMHESFPYDARYHRPSSKAAAGECSQHGIDSCKETPIISFQDRNNRWQSGCQRAHDELVARGEISPLAQH